MGFHMVHAVFLTGYLASFLMPSCSPCFFMFPPQIYFQAITNHACFPNHTTFLQAFVIFLACLASAVISTVIFFRFQAL